MNKPHENKPDSDVLVPAAVERSASPARHTPGPWLIRTGGTMTGRGPEVYVEGEHYDDGAEFVVADCGCSEATGGKRRWKRTPDADAIEANARLIAAAPDGLALARLVVTYFGDDDIDDMMDADIRLRDAARVLIAKAEGKPAGHPEATEPSSQKSPTTKRT